MSSIIERLTEGVVNRDMRSESHALLIKVGEDWSSRRSSH